MTRPNVTRRAGQPPPYQSSAYQPPAYTLEVAIPWHAWSLSAVRPGVGGAPPWYDAAATVGAPLPAVQLLTPAVLLSTLEDARITLHLGDNAGADAAALRSVLGVDAAWTVPAAAAVVDALTRPSTSSVMRWHVLLRMERLGATDADSAQWSAVAVHKALSAWSGTE